jgi:hypothetical protein
MSSAMTATRTSRAVIPMSLPPGTVVGVVGAAVVDDPGWITTVGGGRVGTVFGGTIVVVVAVVVVVATLAEDVVVAEPEGVRTDCPPPPLLRAMPTPSAAASTPASTPATMTDLRSTVLPGAAASRPV